MRVIETSSPLSTSPVRAPKVHDKKARRYRFDDARRELIGIVAFGALVGVAAAIAPHLLPNTPLLHLDQGRVHTGVGLLVCALALFCLRAPRRALMTGLVGAGLCVSVGVYAAQHFAGHTPDRSAELSILSFNVLGSNPRGDELARRVIEGEQDVAVLLEAPAIHGQRALLEAAFPYSAGCIELRDGQLRCDLAIFSRLPLENVETHPFYWIYGRLLTAEIVVGDARVTLVAAHLGKPYWGAIHYDQLAALESVLAEIDGPVILAGDFNTMPFVEAFRASLNERSGMKLASRMQTTWPALPSEMISNVGFAIDHVLVRGAVTPTRSTRMGDPVGSNHRGLVTHFDLDGR